jgi:hypothetical protein
MLDRTTTPADELLSRITMAVALANDAEKKMEGARAEYVSRQRAIGELLLELKQHYPKPKDFEAKLNEVSGLQRSRAYDYMALAGGRKTEAELREEARLRKEKERERKAKEKKEREQAEKAKPAPESVTSRTEAQQVFDSPEAAHGTVERNGKEFHLGSLTHVWRQVEALAAKGDRYGLRCALHSLKLAINEALKSEVLQTPAMKRRKTTEKAK